jgi:hypothetical protein
MEGREGWLTVWLSYYDAERVYLMSRVTAKDRQKLGAG